MYSPDNIPGQTTIVNADPYSLVSIRLPQSASESSIINLPALEGYGFYVDRCDAGCTISIVSQTTGQLDSYPARVGTIVRAPFRGLTINAAKARAFVGAGYTLASYLKLVVFRVPNAPFGTSDTSPCPMHIPIAGQATTDTPLIKEIHIPVPEGARRIERLSLQLSATTIAGAYIQPETIVNGQTFNFLALADYSDPRRLDGSVYSLETLFQTYADSIVQPGTGPTRDINWRCPIVLPSTTMSLFMRIDGTGMADLGFAQFKGNVVYA